MIKNKRGIFFLMITIILISLFVISISFFSAVNFRKSVQKRVETLSDFVSATEEDLDRQLFIFSYRAIFLMESEIVDTGNYLGEGKVPELFEEAFLYGTMDGVTKDILDDATFSDLEFLLKERAAKISADVDLSGANISITQVDPWNLKVNLTMNFSVRDRNNLASWNKTLETVIFVSIENFTDPLYFKETLVAQDIKRHPNPVFGDTASVDNMLDNLWYVNTTIPGRPAPSFIDRLEGNIGGIRPAPRYPEYGIESFVNLDEHSSINPGSARSIVDYMFFSGVSHTSCRISGMPVWFELDLEHRLFYGVGCA